VDLLPHPGALQCHTRGDVGTLGRWYWAMEGMLTCRCSHTRPLAFTFYPCEGQGMPVCVHAAAGRAPRAAHARGGETLAPRPPRVWRCRRAPSTARPRPASESSVAAARPNSDLRARAARVACSHLAQALASHACSLHCMPSSLAYSYSCSWAYARHAPGLPVHPVTTRSVGVCTLKCCKHGHGGAGGTRRPRASPRRPRLATRAAAAG